MISYYSEQKKFILRYFSPSSYLQWDTINLHVHVQHNLKSCIRNLKINTKKKKREKLFVHSRSWRWYIPPLQKLQDYVQWQLPSFHLFLSAKNLEILSTWYDLPRLSQPVEPWAKASGRKSLLLICNYHIWQRNHTDLADGSFNLLLCFNIKRICIKKGLYHTITRTCYKSVSPSNSHCQIKLFM